MEVNEPASDHSAIGLNGDGLDGGVGAGIVSEETGVEGGVGVKAGDAVAGGAVGKGESAADNNLAIRLQGNTIDIGIEAGDGIEGDIR